MLQQIVDEIEKDIPVYKNERIETNVCPNPIIEVDETRRLRIRLDVFQESDRNLQQKKKQTPPRNRYRYRGGIRCQRCLEKLNNSDRRLQSIADSTCKKADVAIFAADMATTAVKNAGEAIAYLRKQAMECEDLVIGTEAITFAKALVQECREARKLALEEAKHAKAQCQKARNAGDDDKQIREYDQLAGTASNDAVNAARNAKSRYILLRDSLDNNLCNATVQDENRSSITIDRVCHEADAAEFGADLAGSAVKDAIGIYSKLKRSRTGM